jgi:hypothetical protein
MREVAPLFADLLSIPTGERYPALTVSPQKRKEKMLAALIAQVEGLSVREPEATPGYFLAPAEDA